MIAIVLNSFIFLVSATVLSYAVGFFERYKTEDNKKAAFIHMAIIIEISAVFNIVMKLDYGKTACYVLFSADRFLKILFIIFLILTISDYCDLPKKLVSTLVSVYMFFSVAMYFFDAFASEGELTQSAFGIFYVSQFTFHRIIHYIVYVVYTVVFLAAIINKKKSVRTRRENPEFLFFSLSVGSCILGMGMEACSLSGIRFLMIPHPLFDLLAMTFAFFLARYNRLCLILRDDYENDLSPARTDIVFILDDEQNIVFESKRAEVLGEIVGDEYAERNFFDVFEFSQKDRENMLSTPANLQFGTDAFYPKLQKHVSIVSDNRTDIYGKIISTTVRVFNIEPKEMTGDSDEMIPDAVVNGTNTADTFGISEDARAILLDNELVFSGEIIDFLKTYGFETELVTDSDTVIRMLDEKDISVIFINDALLSEDVFEAAKKIRAAEDGKYYDLPMILVSSADINTVFTKMLDAEFTDYVYNPIDSVQFDACLKRWLY